MTSKATLWVVALLTATVPMLAGAAECTAVFTDAASSHNNNGELTLERNARIFNSSGTLDFNRIVDNANGGSCFTQNCAVTGEAAEPLDLQAFENTSSNNDVTVARNGSDTLPAGDYKNVKAEQGSSLTFTGSGGTFRMEQLQAERNVRLQLAPGTYWIRNLKIEQGVGVTLSPSGPVVIYIQDGQVERNALVNTGGSEQNLVLISYSNFKLEQGAGLRGIVFTQNDFTLERNAQLWGAVSAGKVKLAQGASITYNAAAVSNADFDGTCGAVAPVPPPIALTLSPSQLTCEAASVVLMACEDEDCNGPDSASQTVTLFPTQGWLDQAGADITGGQVTIPANGTVTVQYQQRTPQTVNVGVSSQSYQCSGGSPGVCDLAFADAAVQFFGASTDRGMATQVAETGFSNANVRAIRSEPAGDTNRCVAALTGEQTMTLSMQCSEPSSCQRPLLHNSTTAITDTGTTDISLTFDNTGTASLSGLTYADAGRISLTGSMVVDGADILLGSGELIVVPDYLALHESDDVSDYDAGRPFTLQLAAFGSDGALLPNYRPGQLQVRLSIAAGDEYPGYLSLSANQNATRVLSSDASEYTDVIGPVEGTDGKHAYSASFAEAGQVLLEVQDIKYMATGVEFGFQSPEALGDFIPAYLSVDAVNDIQFENACTLGNSSYFGQAFGFSQDVAWQLTARNADGDTTRNYRDDDWSWLPSTSEGTDNHVSSVGFSDGQHGDGVVLREPGTTEPAALPGEPSESDGQRLVTFSDMTLAYTRPDTPLVPIADTRATMTLPAALLSDANPNPVCYVDDYDPLNSTQCDDYAYSEEIGGVHLRWGRLVLEDAFGVESESKRVNMGIEYWDGAVFRRNLLDNCSVFSIAPDNIAVSAIPGVDDITGSVSVETTTVNITLGQALTGQGVVVVNPNGVRGQVAIALRPDTLSSQPWQSYLNFDWGNDGTLCSDEAGCRVDGDDFEYDRPDAQVTFGLFTGNERIIHWREVF